MSKVLSSEIQRPIRIFLVGERLTSLQQILASASDIDIIGTAKNGKEALDLIPKKHVQVICTELEMPIMDGLDLTRGIMTMEPRAILVVRRFGQKGDRDKTFQILESGALEVFSMPYDESEGAVRRSVHELIKKIKILSGVMVLRKRQILQEISLKPKTDFAGDCVQAISGIVVIGASTGGPPALKEILAKLPGGFLFPIVCVQHICQGFLQGLVDWLAVDCSLIVAIAQAGELPQAGTVYFPPENQHLKFDVDGRFVFANGSNGDDHVPSVTVAFESAAYRFESHVIGVLLTGMGEDGVEGMVTIAGQGGITIAQNEQSCAVFGMPQRAIEVKAASHILPLQDIASMLISTVAKNTVLNNESSNYRDHSKQEFLCRNEQEF